MDYLTGSDDVSMELLGKQIVIEKRLLPNNWFYSTQLAVLGGHLVYAFFFLFIDSWSLVKIISSILMILCFLILEFTICRLIRSDYFCTILSVFFCIPFSLEFFQMTSVTGFYTFGLSYTLVILILTELYFKTENKIKFLVLFFSVILSIVSGIDGQRMLFNIYLPMLLASFIAYISTRKADWIYYSIITFIGSVLGLIINQNVLSTRFVYYRHDNLSFNSFSIKGIETLINELFTVFGYSEEPLTSIALFKSGVFAIWFLLSLAATIYGIRNRKSVEEGYYRLSLLNASFILLFIPLYSMTDFVPESRYLLEVIALSIPLDASFIVHVKWTINLKKVSCIALIAFTVILSVPNYLGLWDFDSNTEYREIAKKLVDDGYYNGYATFFRSCIMTYLSDGKIEVWSLGDDEFFEINDIDKIDRFLQLRSHQYTHPTGKVFIILSNKELDNTIWKYSLKDKDIILKTDSHIVYGFSSYEVLIDNLYDYDFVFDKEMEFFSLPDNSLDANGVVLTKANTILGPGVTLPPGDYTITIKGRNLLNKPINMNIPSDTWSIVSNDNNLLVNLSLSEKTEDIWFILENDSNNPTIIQEVSITNK